MPENLFADRLSSNVLARAGEGELEFTGDIGGVDTTIALGAKDIVVQYATQSSRRALPGGKVLAGGRPGPQRVQTTIQRALGEHVDTLLAKYNGIDQLAAANSPITLRLTTEVTSATPGIQIGDGDRLLLYSNTIAAWQVQTSDLIYGLTIRSGNIWLPGVIGTTGPTGL